MGVEISGDITEYTIYINEYVIDDISDDLCDEE